MAYVELFERLIARPVAVEAAQAEAPAQQLGTVVEAKNSAVFERLDNYMREGKAWRDPDLQMARVVRDIYTNRTTLTNALQEQGYEGYTDYVNSLRVADFMEIMQGNPSENFQDAFFDAGFRSRNTANRNFRLATGMTATEYFRERHK